ncbi:MAG: Cd(II)/Pb(II)-responsive transcriptional regulator [Pseudomonadales bacterium]
MKIGELAKKVDCSVETIRYYEKVGLLHSAVRDTQNNYRRYNTSHLERLTFVRHCRALAMSQEEILVLLDARNQPKESCASIDQLIDDHIGHVRSRIDELQQLEKQLVDLRAQCKQPHQAGDCGILHGLDQADAQLGTLKSDSHVGGSH